MFERARFHELAGRVYHRLDREALRLTADFIAALFVLDDRMDTGSDGVCRDPVRAARVIEVVRRAARSGKPPERAGRDIVGVASAMADLTRRLALRGAPTHRYLAEIDAYLDGVVDETRHRSTGYRSEEEYARARVAFSAVYVCIELGLALVGRTLPAALRPLARAANLSVSWVNDVFSWPKERALGETSNLVAVFAGQRGLDEAEAFHAACRACDRVVEDYLEAKRRLRAEHQDELAVLEGWIQGNYDWHAVGTARYVEHLSVAHA